MKSSFSLEITLKEMKYNPPAPSREFTTTFTYAKASGKIISFHYYAPPRPRNLSKKSSDILPQSGYIPSFLKLPGEFPVQKHTFHVLAEFPAFSLSENNHSNSLFSLCSGNPGLGQRKVWFTWKSRKTWSLLYIQNGLPTGTASALHLVNFWMISL